MNFTVEMTGDGVSVVDNTKYVYGCTIDGDDALTRDSGFIWKSITPKEKEDVCLTFEITQEEAQAGTTQYWIWNLSNITDNKLAQLKLTNIEVTKTDSPSNPYIDFPNTEILYLDTSSTATSVETIGMSSFVTTASYDELVLKLETISGCEHFVVPIKGLTAGKTYEISFNELTTGLGVKSDKQYDYGAWVGESKSNLTGKNYLCTPSHFTQEQFPHYCVNSVGTMNSNNTYVFQATQSEMYWIWECANLYDFKWGNIHLSEVSIKETTEQAAVFSLKKEEILENTIEDIDEEIIEKQGNIIEQQNNIVEEPENIEEQQNNIIEEQNNIVEEQGNIIEQQNNNVEEQDNIIEQQNNIVEEQGNIIEQQNNNVEEQDNIEEQQNNIVEEQGNIIEQQNNIVEEQNNIEEQQNNIVEEQGNIIEQQNNIVEEQDNIEEQQNNIIEELGGE